MSFKKGSPAEYQMERVPFIFCVPPSERSVLVKLFISYFIDIFFEKKFPRGTERVPFWSVPFWSVPFDTLIPRPSLPRLFLNSFRSSYWSMEWYSVLSLVKRGSNTNERAKAQGSQRLIFHVIFEYLKYFCKI